MSDFKPTSERLLFGQYLLEQKAITKQQLLAALTTQQKEAISHHPRRLGMILLYDHGAFQRDRAVLYKHLKAFDHYKKYNPLHRPGKLEERE